MDHLAKKNKWQSQRKRKQIRYFSDINRNKGYEHIRKHKSKLIRKKSKQTVNMNGMKYQSIADYNDEYRNHLVEVHSDYHYISIQQQMKIKLFIKSQQQTHHNPHMNRSSYKYQELYPKVSGLTHACNIEIDEDSFFHPIINGWSTYGKEQFVTFGALKQIKATKRTFSGFMVLDTTQQAGYMHFDDIGMNDEYVWNKKLILNTYPSKPTCDFMFYSQKRVLFEVEFHEFLYLTNMNVLSWEDCSIPVNIRLPSLPQDSMCADEIYLFINGYMSLCKRMYDLYIPYDVESVIFSYFEGLRSNQLRWNGNCDFSHITDHFLIKGPRHKHNFVASQCHLESGKEYALKIRVLERCGNYNFLGIVSSPQNVFTFLSHHERDWDGPWTEDAQDDHGTEWSFFEFETSFWSSDKSVSVGSILEMKVTVDDVDFVDGIRYTMDLYQTSTDTEPSELWKRRYFECSDPCYLAISFHAYWSRDVAFEIWPETVKDLE